MPCRRSGEVRDGRGDRDMVGSQLEMWRTQESELGLGVITHSGAGESGNFKVL